MLDHEPDTEPGVPAPDDRPTPQAEPDVPAVTPRHRRAASRPSGPPPPTAATEPVAEPEPSVAPALPAPTVTFQPPTAAPQPTPVPSVAAADAPAAEVAADVVTGGGSRPSPEEPAVPRRRRRRRAGEDTGVEDTGVEDTGVGVTGGGVASPEPGEQTTQDAGDEPGESDTEAELGDQTGGATRRRRRRRRRRSVAGGEDNAEPVSDDPPETVVHVREPREREADEVTSVRGSTRLEAKKQRRREGREQGRRRPAILTESEFLARRESVERVMVVRQRGERTQIAVLEDGVLVEHFVERTSSGSLVGNVYLGRVQNVLPSMEAAFVDIGRGRNGVLYAGEVNYDASGLEGKITRIEQALKSGQAVLVQATKDPIAHKGARLTSQVSLPGRFLVYVPDGSMTGISRKLPDTERSRLKAILKRVMPEGAGVIVRTAAEGASEDELARDIARLQAQWEDIEKKARTATPPALLYGEPDLTIRVVRDIFNEDFSNLVVQGDEEWDIVQAYVGHVASDLAARLQRWTAQEDAFAAYRVDEQLAKALDRKVWLPSGGSLVIDRTEAMTVIDVNTGRFTGQGGNLEETVTRNNLEAAEEIVRQLRLRDIGGIIVIDFIDMVLESNRELVLRRFVECLGRDRTKHQVAEVTSLGLVQMTRKRVGGGLLEAFSEPCDCCNGRGVKVSLDLAEPKPQLPAESSVRRGRGRPAAAEEPAVVDLPTPTDVIAATDEPAATEEPQPEQDAVLDGAPAEVAATLDDAVPIEEPVEEPTEEPIEEKPPRPRRRRASRKTDSPPVPSDPEAGAARVDDPGTGAPASA